MTMHYTVWSDDSGKGRWTMESVFPTHDAADAFCAALRGIGARRLQVVIGHAGAVVRPK
jgi:hypothetical protein